MPENDDFKRDELVNITTKGARINVDHTEDDVRILDVTFPSGTSHLIVIDDAVTVERHEEPDPEFPATKAGGHSLLIEYGDEELYGSCQCGRDLGSIRPNQSIDTTLAQSWERHVMTEVPRP